MCIGNYLNKIVWVQFPQHINGFFLRLPFQPDTVTHFTKTSTEIYQHKPQARDAGQILHLSLLRVRKTNLSHLIMDN